MTASSRSDFAHTWAWPLMLGVLIASGLLTALLSEGWGDVWSWVALGVPVAVMARFSLIRPAARLRDASPSSSSHNHTKNRELP